MPHFIFFHGILVNAAEYAALYIAGSDKGNASVIVCMPKDGGSPYRIPLDVPYEQAKSEWIEMLKAPPVQQHTHADGTTHIH